MGRGKIEIKRIENPTNRQVTYSKRRNGLFKKAQELTVLCDAKVSLIMISNTGKFHEFVSPTTTTKKMLDEYQRISGIDLWSTHYAKMQETYKQLKEVNNKLRRDIRQRLGEDLEELSYAELQKLEDSCDDSVSVIRERKYHVIKTQTNTTKKKVKNFERNSGGDFLLVGVEPKYEGTYGMVENEEDYESAIAMATGASNLYAIRLNQNYLAGGFAPHDLCLYSSASGNNITCLR